MTAESLFLQECVEAIGLLQSHFDEPKDHRSGVVTFPFDGEIEAVGICEGYMENSLVPGIVL